MGIPRFWRLQSQNYRLIGEVCHTCGSKVFPPRNVCPECAQPAYEPFTFSDQDKVYSHTAVFSPPQNYENYALHAVALVKLEEGPLVTA